jgi:hypothetical protein
MQRVTNTNSLFSLDVTVQPYKALRGLLFMAIVPEITDDDDDDERG